MIAEETTSRRLLGKRQWIAIAAVFVVALAAIYIGRAGSVVQEDDVSQDEPDDVYLSTRRPRPLVPQPTDW